MDELLEYMQEELIMLYEQSEVLTSKIQKLKDILFDIKNTETKRHLV